MASDKQIEANRANAQKSTGPRTEEGKKRSSMNAVRHGLTGVVLLLTEEESSALLNFSTLMVGQLKPVGEHETFYAESYAFHTWRAEHASATHGAIFSVSNIEDIAGENLDIVDPEVHTVISNAKTLRRDSAQLNRIALYTQRIANMADRALRALRLLQADRQKLELQEMQEALLIYRAHKRAGAIFEPEKNGFVFSLPQIAAYDRRENMKLTPEVREMLEKGELKAA